MAARYKWIVDPATGQGHAVEMTADEQTQLEADQAAAAAQAVVDQQSAQNASSVLASLNTRMGKIRQARTALANGNIFGGLTANEKAILDGLLEDDLYLARLALHLYDGVT